LTRHGYKPKYRHIITVNGFVIAGRIGIRAIGFKTPTPKANSPKQKEKARHCTGPFPGF